MRKHSGRTSRTACPSFFVSFLFVPLGARIALLKNAIKALKQRIAELIRYNKLRKKR